MGIPTQADPRDRKYLSPYSTEGVGLVVHRLGQPADADGDVEVTMALDSESETPGSTTNSLPAPASVFTANRVGPGQYKALESAAETARPGLYSLRWQYTMDGTEMGYVNFIEIGQPNHVYDPLPPEMKDIIETCWIRFADLYDSPGGGPHLQTYFQTKYNRGRLADLLYIAIGTLNTVSQPWSTFTVDGQGGKAFPVDQWGSLLERSLYIEALKHLVRSYTEIPMLQAGDALTRFDRRDYMQRWQSILQDEQATMKSQLDMFKMSQMGLGNSAILVGGGIFGRIPPSTVAGGSSMGRPRLWSRFYG